MWNPFRKRADAGDTEDAAPIKTDKKGWIRWPGRVVPKPFKGEHRQALNLALEAFKTDRPACPDCRQNGRYGVLMPVADDPMSRKCNDPECGMVITLNALAMANAPALHYAPAKRRDYFLRQATFLFVIGCAFLAAATLYAGYSRSVFMFAAALIVAVPVFSAVFVLRYRAWQADKGRFYEAQAPFGDFVRDELNSLFPSRVI